MPNLGKKKKFIFSPQISVVGQSLPSQKRAWAIAQVPEPDTGTHPDTLSPMHSMAKSCQSHPSHLQTTLLLSIPVAATALLWASPQDNMPSRQLQKLLPRLPHAPQLLIT